MESTLPTRSEVKGIYAVETEKDGEKVLEDVHGRPIHDEYIIKKIKHPDLKFIHATICLVLEKGLTPEPEIGPCITLLEMIAEQEPEVYKDGTMGLPVNYFAGLWHCLNTARAFKLYDKQKSKEKNLDKITMEVAESLDAYHKAKKHEQGESYLNDKNYLEYLSKMKAPKQIAMKTGKTKSVGGFKNKFFKKLTNKKP